MLGAVLLWLGCLHSFVRSVCNVYTQLPCSAHDILAPDVECTLWSIASATGSQEVSSKEYTRHLRFVAWNRQIPLINLLLAITQDKLRPLPDGFSARIVCSKNHMMCVTAIANHFKISLDSEIVDRELLRLTSDGSYKDYALSTDDVRAELHDTLLELLVLRNIGAYLHSHRSEYIKSQLHTWEKRSKEKVYVLHEFRMAIDKARSAAEAQSIFKELVGVVTLGDIDMVHRIDSEHSDSHSGRIVSTHSEMLPLPKQLIQEAIDAVKLEPGLVITHPSRDALYLYIVQSIIQPQVPTVEAITDVLAADYLTGMISKYLTQCHIQYTDAAEEFGIARDIV